jgi:hypothetical protein
MALDGSVHEIIAKDDRLAIIKGLWQLGTMPQSSRTKVELTLQDLKTYFHYYSTECRNALSQEGEHTTVRKHKDIITIAKSLDDGLSKKDIQMPLLQLDTQNRSNEVKKKKWLLVL